MATNSQNIGSPPGTLFYNGEARNEPVKPNEWNKGSTIIILSVGLRSSTEETCATFAKILLFECTTPFGLPSEPEVNNIIAG